MRPKSEVSQPNLLIKLIKTILLASNIEYFFFLEHKEISSPDENIPTLIFLKTFIFFKPREDNCVRSTVLIFLPSLKAT